MTTSDKCRICGQPHPWSDGTTPKHPFDDGSGTSTAFLGARRADGTTRRGANDAQRGSQGPLMGQPRPAYPIDPVLRQALVDAGIITPEQLRAAEEKIQAITGLFNEGRENAQSTKGPWRGQVQE